MCRGISNEVSETPVITEGIEDCLGKGISGLYKDRGSLFTRLMDEPEDGNLAGIRLGGEIENSLGKKRFIAGGVGPGGAGIHP